MSALNTAPNPPAPTLSSPIPTPTQHPLTHTRSLTTTRLVPDPGPQSSSDANQNQAESRTQSVPTRRLDERREYHYDVDNNEFDFRKLRPTDLPFNKQLFLPQNDNSREVVEEEIQLAFLSRELEKATDAFVSTHKVKPNVTDQERKGLKSLKKRKDAVVFQTDKSSRFSVDTRENYVAACEKHTERDEIINEQEYQSLINEVNAHSVMWSKILT